MLFVDIQALYKTVNQNSVLLEGWVGFWTTSNTSGAVSLDVRFGDRP